MVITYLTNTILTSSMVVTYSINTTLILSMVVTYLINQGFKYFMVNKDGVIEEKTRAEIKHKSTYSKTHIICNIYKRPNDIVQVATIFRLLLPKL